jgi:hypothetical protein
MRQFPWLTSGPRSRPVRPLAQYDVIPALFWFCRPATPRINLQEAKANRQRRESTRFKAEQPARQRFRIVQAGTACRTNLSIGFASGQTAAPQFNIVSSRFNIVLRQINIEKRSLPANALAANPYPQPFQY